MELQGPYASRPTSVTPMYLALSLIRCGSARVAHHKAGWECEVEGASTPAKRWAVQVDSKFPTLLPRVTDILFHAAPLLSLYPSHSSTASSRLDRLAVEIGVTSKHLL